MWDEPNQPPAPRYPDDASYPAEPYPPSGTIPGGGGATQPYPTPGGVVAVFVGMLGELVMRRR